MLYSASILSRCMGIARLVSVVVFCCIIQIISQTESVAQLLQPYQKKRDTVAFTSRGQRFIEQLMSNHTDSCYVQFDSSMRKLIPEIQLQKMVVRLRQQQGKLQKIDSTTYLLHDNFNVTNVHCDFDSNKVIFMVTFDNSFHIAGLYLDVKPKRAPKPIKYEIDKGKYFEKEVYIKTEPGMTPGALTYPKSTAGQKKFPCVILIHGSGPQDKDETLGKLKPFRDIAAGLSERGLAVYRFDKRTKSYTREIERPDTMTLWGETIEDALEAVRVIKKEPFVDSTEIFVLGHSIGGMALPAILANDSTIRGVIGLAAPARPLEDIIIEQIRYIWSLKDSLTFQDKQDLEMAEWQTRYVKDSAISSRTPRAYLPLGIYPMYWSFLKSYNWLDLAKKQPQPMLFLQGGRDYQVTLEDLKIWKKTLSQKNNVQFKEYQNLNHMFVEGIEKATPAEYEKPGFVAKEVLDDIASWVMGIARKDKTK